MVEGVSTLVVPSTCKNSVTGIPPDTHYYLCRGDHPRGDHRPSHTSGFLVYPTFLS